MSVSYGLLFRCFLVIGALVVSPIQGAVNAVI